MSDTTQSSMLIKSPADAPEVNGDPDGEMTERTAAELRDLCERKGEEFDTALTEGQARERIAALKDD